MMLSKNECIECKRKLCCSSTRHAHHSARKASTQAPPPAITCAAPTEVDEPLVRRTGFLGMTTESFQLGRAPAGAHKPPLVQLGREGADTDREPPRADSEPLLAALRAVWAASAASARVSFVARGGVAASLPVTSGGDCGVCWRCSVGLLALRGGVVDPPRTSGGVC